MIRCAFWSTGSSRAKKSRCIRIPLASSMCWAAPLLSSVIQRAEQKRRLPRPEKPFGVIRRVMAWNCIGTGPKKNGRARRTVGSRCIRDHWIWIHCWRRRNPPRRDRWLTGENCSGTCGKHRVQLVRRLAQTPLQRRTPKSACIISALRCGSRTSKVCFVVNPEREFSELSRSCANYASLQRRRIVSRRFGLAKNGHGSLSRAMRMIILISLLPAMCMAAFAQDPVTTSPQYYKVLLEND